MRHRQHDRRCGSDSYRRRTKRPHTSKIPRRATSQPWPSWPRWTIRAITTRNGIPPWRYLIIRVDLYLKAIRKVRSLLMRSCIRRQPPLRHRHPHPHRPHPHPLPQSRPHSSHSHPLVPAPRLSFVSFTSKRIVRRVRSIVRPQPRSKPWSRVRVRASSCATTRTN